MDEEAVKPCIQDRLRAFLGSKENQLIFLSFTIITIIFVLFVYVPPLKQYWTSFYPAVMATFLGIFLGFTLDRILAIMQEKATINKILISIMKELEINIKDLEDWEFKDKTLYFMRTQNTAFDSAIGGGYFSLMDSETQHKLSVLYAQINYMTYISDKTLLMEEDNEIMLRINSMLNMRLASTIEEHKEVIKYLRARVRLKR